MAAAVLSDVVCELGEGPSYDPATDTLYWFDILASRMLERKLSGGETRIHQLGEMASAIAKIDDQRQLLLTETGLHIRDALTGRTTLHVSVEAANTATRSNDARVHPCGALWFGTMGKKAEAGAGAIYWFFRGELRLLFPAITIPNSICFTADGKTAYYADTAVNLLYRVDCDADTGLPVGEPRLFVDGRRGPAASTVRSATATACCGTPAGAAAGSMPMRPMAACSAACRCRPCSRPARPSSALRPTGWP